MSRRQLTTMRKLLRDDGPELVGRNITRCHWEGHPRQILVDMVERGETGRAICEFFNVPYPGKRKFVYNEIDRLRDAYLIGPGRLGRPRRPVGSSDALAAQPRVS